MAALLRSTDTLPEAQLPKKADTNGDGEHEAKIAHRLQDGAIWAGTCAPWEPLNVDGAKFEQIRQQLLDMRHRPGFGNIHHIIAMLLPQQLRPSGGLVSVPAEVSPKLHPTVAPPP